MNIFSSIILNNIIPIFVLICLGYIIDKKFKPDMNTLTKINFYLFVPAFSFVNIYTTNRWSLAKTVKMVAEDQTKL